jgi:flagellar motor switch protein FliM
VTLEPLLSDQERAAIEALQRPTTVVEGPVPQVRPLDLVSRDHLALAQLAHLQTAADRWASSIELHLMRELHQPCAVKPRPVEVLQAPHALPPLSGLPFAFSLVVNQQPRGGVLVIERPLATAYAVCQFGGQIDASDVALATTAISRRTVARLARRLLDLLATQLAPLGVRQASVVEVLDDDSPPPRSTALFDASVTLAESEVRVFVAIATSVADFSPPPAAVPAPPIVQALLAPEVHRTHIAVTSVLGRAALTMRRLIELKPGDVVVLDTPVDGEIDVLVAGKPKFHGKPINSSGRLSLQITGTTGA